MNIINSELLEKAGLEAKENEKGEIVIQQKEVVLENGGKWLPDEGSPYYVVFQNGINTTAERFLTFNPKGEFEKRHLCNGIVFPTMEMAERVTQKFINAIKDEWEKYGKDDEPYEDGTGTTDKADS